MTKSSAPPNGGTPHRMATWAKNATAHLVLPDVVGWNPDEPECIPLPPAERCEAAAATKKAGEAAEAYLFDTSCSGEGDSTPGPVPQIGADPAGTSLDDDQAIQNVGHAAVDTEFIEDDQMGNESASRLAGTPEDGVNKEEWLSEEENPKGEVESEASTSEFEPAEDVEQDSEDGEGEGEAELESPVKKKNRRQAKVHRADVTAARSGSAAIQKWKIVTSSITHEEIKKPKLAATPSGLRAGWNTVQGPAGSRLTSAPGPRKTATILLSVAIRSNAPTTPTLSIHKTSSVYTNHSTSNVNARKDGGRPSRASVPRRTGNDGLNVYGGLPDEENTAEGSALARAAAPAWPLKCLNSDTSGTDDSFPADKLTDVVHVPAPSVVAVNHHPVGPSNANNHRRWATTDLAADMHRQFTQAFIPLTRVTVSRLQPWYSLTMEEQQLLFDRVFPTYNHVIEVNDIVFSLPTWAPRQMNSRITEWQGKFAAAAMSVVEAHFVEAHMAEPEARASWCRAPFLWRVWEDGKKQGCFQGVLVLKTFGIVHIPVLQSIPLALRQGEAQGDAEMRPCGALILAVLTVERALRVWQTGSRIVGKGHAGNFSADNWGDKTVVSHGVAKPTTKVANMFARAQKMSLEQWIAILDDSCDHHRAHKLTQDKQAIVIESASDAVMTDSDAEY
ncbi:hypothetical protein C2E23DRAFT_862786 [Lenzites betulinus]|nr:hypothetical protein C2E23DRAFT_862786 [Lenzites betulinus]